MTINGLLFIELSAAPLSVSLPSLTTAFRVWANRILPACYGTDLLQQLEDAGLDRQRLRRRQPG